MCELSLKFKLVQVTGSCRAHPCALLYFDYFMLMLGRDVSQGDLICVTQVYVLVLQQLVAAGIAIHV